MVRIEGHRLIRAPVQKVFQLVSHLDAQPRVTGLWMVADVVERKANTLTVHYRGYFGGMPVESIQRATLFPPQRVEFRQTRGALKAFRGEYVLKSIEGDTDLALSVEAEVGIPLISEDSARHVLQAFVEHSLQKFKLTAERDLPRVVRRPAEAAPAAEAPSGEAAAPEPAASEPVRAEAPPVQQRPQPPQAPGTAAGQAPGQGKRRRRRRRRRRRGGGPQPSGPQNPGSGSGPLPS
jgi:ribosome-associated toxin RatA of RatAB toxin-antitoxin module